MKFEPLSKDHDLQNFSSGRTSVDNWLKLSAKRAVKDGSASVYVFREDEHTNVAAYVALCSQSVPPDEELPTRVAKPKTRNPIPALLIAQLGVDQNYQGQGLGGKLLKKSFQIALEVSERIGVKVIITHALDDEAAAFYRHFGFEFHENRPMVHYLLVKDLRANAR